MNEEMSTETAEVAVTAIEKHSGNYENSSKMLQEELCKRYGGGTCVFLFARF